MNYLLVLYEQHLFDKIIVYLKQAFKEKLSAIDVETLVKDQLTQFTWEGLLDPNEVAQEMTEIFPTLIIEAPSVSGIDSSSRYFNKTQLW